MDDFQKAPEAGEGNVVNQGSELEPKNQLLRLLDQNEAKFEKDLAGQLTKEGFFQFQMLITESVTKQFKVQKEELMQQRISAFKEQDWNGYANMIQKAAQQMNLLNQENTMNACIHSNFTPEQFQAMMKRTFEDQVYKNKFEVFKLELASKVDGVVTNFQESRQKIKDIFLDYKTQEGQLHVRSSDMMAQNQQQLQAMMMMERTKMMDSIYVKYNMKVNYMMAAVSHYGIGKDQDLIDLQNTFKVQVDAKRSLIESKQKLDETDKALIDSLFKELVDGPQIQLDSRGMIPQEMQIEIHKKFSIMSYTLRERMVEAAKPIRRQLLKDGKMEEYETTITDAENGFKLKMMPVQMYALQSLKIVPQQYNVGMQYMQKNSVLQQKLVQAQNEALDNLEKKDEAKAVLTKEDALRVVTQMEESKIDVMQKVIKLAEAQMWSPQLTQMKMQVERTKAFDTLFNEQGVSEEDIAKAMQEHNLAKDEEFIAMQSSMQARAAKFIPTQ